MNKIRKRIVFYGYVQGVGFRYKARYSAENPGISGWVRNMDNGAVEMEAEGYPEDIDTLIDKLKNHSWGSVQDIDIKTIPTEGGYSFDII